MGRGIRGGRLGSGVSDGEFKKKGRLVWGGRGGLCREGGLCKLAWDGDGDGVGSYCGGLFAPAERS